MIEIQFQLRRYGLWLFLLGLLLGFVLPVFANRPLALGVHVAALLGGTFLMSLASFWPSREISTRVASVTGHALALGLLGLDLGLMLMATLADPMQRTGLRSLAVVVNLCSSLVMLFALGAILIGFQRPRDTV